MSLEKFTKILFGGPRGDAGKSTLAAQVTLMLSAENPDTEFLLFDFDDTDSKGLTKFFNVASERGVYEFLNGMPLDELWYQVRDNVYFVPSGDFLTFEGEKLFASIDGNGLLAERMKPYENRFGYIGIDSSQNLKNRLGKTLLDYVDTLSLTVSTRGMGAEAIQNYFHIIEAFNLNSRESEGKAPLQLAGVVPYWFTRSNVCEEYLDRIKSSVCWYFGIDVTMDDLYNSELPEDDPEYEPLEDEAKEVINTILTEPMGQCVSLERARIKSQSLRELFGKKKPDKSTQKALRIFDTIISNISE